jgi:hypothetical protein
MQWLIGALALVAVGVALRRVLRMDFREKPRGGGLVPLCAELHAIYHPVAREIEAHATILGITLNDAFGEREANQHAMAWHIVRLARGEWDRLSGLVVGLQNILAKYLPATHVVVPVRRISAGNLKSRTLIDYVGLYEFLDQVVFGSKRRFSLQLRVLSRTCVLLTKEFRHTCLEGEFTHDVSPGVWNRLDFYFHDFDLIAKETLLAFRSLLACQSPEGVRDLSFDLHNLLERSVRVSTPVTDQ